MFCKRGHKKDGPGACPPCSKIQQAAWHSANIARRHRESSENYHRRKNEILMKQKHQRISDGGIHREYNWKRYGIKNDDGSDFKLQDYNRHFQVQGGMCRICGRHQSELKKSLYADHDHETGFFRGLLCINCNHAIGLAYDNPKILHALAQYVEESR